MDLSEWVPLLTIGGAIIGSLTGLAAFLRSNSDRSKSVAEGAGKVTESAVSVVNMLEKRVAALERQFAALEKHLNLYETWTDKVLDLLERAIKLVTGPESKALEQEAEMLRRVRPTRRYVPDEDTA